MSDMATTASTTSSSATSTTSTSSASPVNCFPYFNSTVKYNQELHFSPVILNVKRGVWHALVRTAAQLQLKNMLAHKSDETNNNRWNIGWVDKASMVFYKSLSRYQKVNHLLGVEQLCRKRNLARVARHIHAITDERGSNEYNFIPRSWVLPRELEELRKHMKSKADVAKQNNEELPAYIIKPGSSCQGRGIYLAQTLEQIEVQQGYVVQEYIHNPLTILNRKFDLRIYVLQTSSQPLRLYIYEDGLARFCTKAYEKPSSTNIKTLFSHLTNFSLNKLNKEEFVDTGNTNDGGEGGDDMETTEDQEFNPKNNKWSLLQFNDYIFKTFGLDRFTTMWQNINDIIIKTIMGGLPIMNQAYTNLCDEMKSTNNVNYVNRAAGFQLYGFDIMFDENWKPWLIEVNRNPSLRCEASVDEYIKTQLLGQLAMILDPVSSLSPSNEQICHVATKIYEELQQHELYASLFDGMTENFKRIYIKLVETADPQAISSGTPNTVTPFFTTRVSDGDFWTELVKNDTTHTSLNAKQSLILFLQSIFDVERLVAQKLYSGPILSAWFDHKDRYELQCRLFHEDMAVDMLHETTQFWHSPAPTPYSTVLNSVKLPAENTTSNQTTASPPPTDPTQSAPESTQSTNEENLTEAQKIRKTILHNPQSVFSPPLAIPTCVGSANIGGYTPLLGQSPNYRRNGFSKLVTKHQPIGQPTASLQILRDPRTNIPIYASNFRTIFPIEPYSDYPYPYSPSQHPKHPVDFQIEAMNKVAQSKDQQGELNTTSIPFLPTQNVTPTSTSAEQPSTPTTTTPPRTFNHVIPRYLRPQERQAAMKMYEAIFSLTTRAAQQFISIATLEATSGTMGLAGYPTIAWSNPDITDERSVRELQMREQERQRNRQTQGQGRR